MMLYNAQYKRKISELIMKLSGPGYYSIDRGSIDRENRNEMYVELSDTGENRLYCKTPILKPLIIRACFITIFFSEINS